MRFHLVGGATNSVFRSGGRNYPPSPNKKKSTKWPSLTSSRQPTIPNTLDIENTWVTRSRLSSRQHIYNSLQLHCNPDEMSYEIGLKLMG